MIQQAQRYLRNWLGLNDIDSLVRNLRSDMLAHEYSIKDVKTAINIHNSALARLIAKLDPNYGVSELTPERRKESDEIANRVMKQILAEHLARQHTEGKL